MAFSVDSRQWTVVGSQSICIGSNKKKSQNEVLTLLILLHTVY